jgi:hypothetical protein
VIFLSLTLLQEASFILLSYNMSLIRALKDLFPNIGIKESEFAYVPRMYLIFLLLF